MEWLTAAKIYWLFIILIKCDKFDCGNCQTHSISYSDVADTVKASFFTYKPLAVGDKIPITEYTITKIATSSYRGFTQLVILAEKGSSTIVAFRGTKDIKMFQLYLKDYINHLSHPENRREVYINNQRVTIFEFFWGAFQSLLPKIERDLENGNRRYILTGHSSGGALASLLAIQLKSQKSNLWNNSQSSLITFGAPRVGDSRYAKLHDEMIPSHQKLRFTNKGDVISILPFKPAFVHHSREVYGEEKKKISWRGISTTYVLRFCPNGDSSNSCLNRSFKNKFNLPLLLLTGFHNHMAYEKKLTSGRREYLDAKGEKRNSWNDAWDASC